MYTFILFSRSPSLYSKRCLYKEASPQQKLSQLNAWHSQRYLFLVFKHTHKNKKIAVWSFIRLNVFKSSWFIHFHLAYRALLPRSYIRMRKAWHAFIQRRETEGGFSDAWHYSAFSRTVSETHISRFSKCLQLDKQLSPCPSYRKAIFC